MSVGIWGILCRFVSTPRSTRSTSLWHLATLTSLISTPSATGMMSLEALKVVVTTRIYVPTHWRTHQFANWTDRFAIFCPVRKPDKRFTNWSIYVNSTHLMPLQVVRMDMILASYNWLYSFHRIQHDAISELLSSLASYPSF
jgi:hypothetical protein